MAIGDLFRPKWQHSSAAVRKPAVKQLTDDTILANIAQNDPDHGVRLAAVTKIADTHRLARILHGEIDTDVWQTALARISDQTLLAEIQRCTTSAAVRTAVVKKLAELLRAAIMRGDSAAALSLLGIPADHYLDPDKYGWTPLHCAAFTGDLQVLELLLAKGAPADTRDNRNQWTALHYAAAHGHSHLVAPLIKGGADPNAVAGSCRDTPLHRAALGVPQGFVTPLQKEAPRLTEAAFRQQTRSHPGTAAELLKQGADPHLLCGQGYLPLHVAAERDDIPYGEALIAGGADPNKRGLQESTALHWAAAKKNSEFGTWLLGKGAQPDLVDALGWTPLFVADAYGTTELIPVLLAAGARTEATINGKSVTFPATAGATASPPATRDPDQELIEASEAGDLAAAKAALDAGANVNSRSRDGWTPLLSASRNHTRIVELLLANGADPNCASNRGYTPLMRAAGNGSENIVHLLLVAGSDRQLVDCNGKNAHRLAMETGWRTCAQLVR